MNEHKVRFTRGTWWSLGALAYATWAISASLDGAGPIEVLAVAALALVWVAAVYAVDLWVRRGVDLPP